MTYKMTVKVVVTHFVEILRCTFDFSDCNSPQSCLTVAPPSFSNTVQPSPFRVFEIFQSLLDEILAIVVGFGFQFRDVLH